MTVELRSLTPPKFVEALKEKEAPLLLEERLVHFMQWLMDQGCEVYNGDNDLVTSSKAKVLIDEYVNE